MVIIIAIIGIFGMVFYNELKICETKPSPLCYTIHCPCDNSTAPCFGYAKMKAEKEGQWYCSNAPLTAVDSNGNIIR